MKPVLTILISSLATAAFAQRPSEEESTRLLDRARIAALNYSASLPDFICTQLVHRNEGTADFRGTERWRQIDVLTVRLSYFGRAEDYKLTEINGKPTDQDFMKVGGGANTKGEFGTLLLLIFHPDSKAEFKWKGWTRYKKYRAGTYSYRIDQEHSGYGVSYGAAGQNENMIHPAYHGDFQFDPENGLILHVSQEAEMPLGYPIKQSSVTVDYDFTDVGGRRYLLPSRAVILVSAGRYKGRNVVEFKDYRKFASESTISFDK